MNKEWVVRWITKEGERWYTPSFGPFLTEAEADARIKKGYKDHVIEKIWKCKVSNPESLNAPNFMEGYEPDESS